MIPSLDALYNIHHEYDSVGVPGCLSLSTKSSIKSTPPSQASIYTRIATRSIFDATLRCYFA